MSEAKERNWWPRTYSERVDELYVHLRRHGIKQWLLEGAYDEDACTVHAAITCIRSDALCRRLARALAQDWDGKAPYLREPC
jgi:hypothetical protein